MTFMLITKTPFSRSGCWLFYTRASLRIAGGGEARARSIVLNLGLSLCALRPLFLPAPLRREHGGGEHDHERGANRDAAGEAGEKDRDGVHAVLIRAHRSKALRPAARLPSYLSLRVQVSGPPRTRQRVDSVPGGSAPAGGVDYSVFPALRMCKHKVASTDSHWVGCNSELLHLARRRADDDHHRTVSHTEMCWTMASQFCGPLRGPSLSIG